MGKENKKSLHPRIFNAHFSRVQHIHLFPFNFRRVVLIWFDEQTAQMAVGSSQVEDQFEGKNGTIKDIYNILLLTERKGYN